MTLTRVGIAQAAAATPTLSAPSTQNIPRPHYATGAWMGCSNSIWHPFIFQCDVTIEPGTVQWIDDWLEHHKDLAAATVAGGIAILCAAAFKNAVAAAACGGAALVMFGQLTDTFRWANRPGQAVPECVKIHGWAPLFGNIVPTDIRNVWKANTYGCNRSISVVLMRGNPWVWSVSLLTLVVIVAIACDAAGLHRGVSATGFGLAAIVAVTAPHMSKRKRT